MKINIKKRKPTVLVVDDRREILDAIDLSIGDETDLTGVTSAQAACDLLSSRDFDVVLADYNLGSDTTGLDVFKLARQKNPFVTACMMTGERSLSVMRQVFDAFEGLLIEKPFSENCFDELLARARMNILRREEYQVLPKSDDSLQGLVAESPAMTRVIDQVRRVAPHQDVPVYMSGETGTGKSVLARAIHDLSEIKGAFQTVTCSSIEPDLAYSALFGHKRGAFTGATEDRAGFIEKANGGTLFLDELHLLPRSVQGKLLRVLQDGKYVRLGENHERTSAFRLITAASVDLREMARKDKFIKDLWFRISTKVIPIAPLRERKACIPKLVYRFLREFGDQNNQTYEIDNGAMNALVAFSWAGNIRDLRSSIRVLCTEVEPGQPINTELVKEDLKQREGNESSSVLQSGTDYKTARRRFEIELITDALRKHNGSIGLAAKWLKVPRQTLRSRLDALEIRA